MANQIRVGLLISFCVQWLCYLPVGAGGVVVTVFFFFSPYVLSAFSRLTFRLVFSYGSTLVCSDTIPPTVLTVQCFTQTVTLKVWNSGSLRCPERPLEIWASQSLWVLFLSQRHHWEPSLGVSLNWHFCQHYDYLGCKRVLWLAETLQRSLRDLLFLPLHSTNMSNISVNIIYFVYCIIESHILKVYY